MAKGYKIQVKGWVYGPVSGILADVMADMLRYDQGVIESVQETPYGSFGHHSFVAIVNCKTYTKGRWASFILDTEVLGRF